MGFLKRLFSRSSSTLGDRSGPGAFLPFGSAERKTVPPNHHVTYYTRTLEPGVQRTHGGVFIVNLGSASDEFQEELRQITDEVDRWVSMADRESGKTHPTRVLLSTDGHWLSDLFAPNDIRVDSLHGLLLWVIDAGAAHLWLREPDALLAAIRRVGAYRLNGGPIGQFVLLGIESRPGSTVGISRGGEVPNPEPPPGTLELARLLSEAEVPVSAIPEDGLFFVEVCRPDAVISALRKAPFPGASPSNKDLSRSDAPGASHFVIRAPRLRRLTLAALKTPTEATSRQLFEELLSRRIALLVICDQEGQFYESSWPGIGDGLAVYPDLSSLLQAAEDLQLDPNSLAWAHFSPRDLFTWADQELFDNLALNTYKNRTTPMYFFINRIQIHALARGRILDAHDAAR